MFAEVSVVVTVLLKLAISSTIDTLTSFAYLVEVGVRVWVAESVTVPGTRVVVMVLVVDGVGMLRQEQALEMAEAAQLDGKQVGFCTALRFWFSAVVVAVYAVLKQESVTVDVVRVTVAVSVCR